MTKPKRTMKKSDTIEVRVPYETKLALQKACEDEGITISAMVRDCVDRKLNLPARHAPRRPLTPTLMELIDMIKTRPRFAAGALASLAILTTFTGLILTTLSPGQTAIAQDLELSLLAQWDQFDGTRSDKRTTSTSLTLEYGQPVTLKVAAPSDSNLSDHRYEITARDCATLDTQSCSRGAIEISLKIYAEEADGDVLLSQPTIVALNGEPASMSVSAAPHPDSLYLRTEPSTTLDIMLTGRVLSQSHS